MNAAGSIAGADSRGLLAVAADLATCQRPQDLETPLMSTLALIGADAMGCGELRHEARGAPMDIFPQIAYPEVFDAEALEHWSTHWRQHPVVVRQLRGPEPRALRLSDFLSRRRLQRLGIYPAYRRLGLRGEIALQLEWERGRISCMSMHRTRRDFGERERALLDQIALHLRAARARIVLGLRARRQRELLERGLDDSGAGVLLVDASHRIDVMSRGAAETLRRWFPAAAAPDRLPTELADWLAGARRNAGPASWSAHSPSPAVRRRCSP